ncbi:hypothetical protein FSW04_12265 [Baekduia soli]|uniref:Uncharacterized protein n=1 Tax=Baekduia soli TaxID=496014 RepID=A0A5B8U592_9ACTN|nr:hypothetical protein [Baekduia soli]QEC48264.1 hypothetical protein FSW04_12265 [Baekduia soli]
MTVRTSPGMRGCGIRAADLERPLLIGSCTYLVAAAGVSIAHSVVPITRGWWLVAFLGLVGGASQWLLGAGLTAVSGSAAPRSPGEAPTQAKALLWNGGTMLVAVADLAGLTAGVLVGSAALLASLALFGMRLREVAPDRHITVLKTGYVTLLMFLAISVFVGAGLAGALPAP